MRKSKQKKKFLQLLTSITRPLLHNDVQDPLKGILKCHNLLDVGVAFGQLVQQQQGLQTEETSKGYLII